MLDSSSTTEQKLAARRHLSHQHLALLLVCRKTRLDCQLLPFSLNTFVFDSGLPFLTFLGKLTRRQKSAVKNLNLEVVWSRKDQLMFGTQSVVQGVVQYWTRRLPGLKTVQIEIRYGDRLPYRADAWKSELVGKLGPAMGKLKRWIEEERPGVECTVRAVEPAHPTI
jgi:hypothetical protein